MMESEVSELFLILTYFKFQPRLVAWEIRILKLRGTGRRGAMRKGTGDRQSDGGKINCQFLNVGRTLRSDLKFLLLLSLPP